MRAEVVRRNAANPPSHGRGHMFDPCITHQIF
jgi:hypothetical protein